MTPADYIEERAHEIETELGNSLAEIVNLSNFMDELDELKRLQSGKNNLKRCIEENDGILASTFEKYRLGSEYWKYCTYQVYTNTFASRSASSTSTDFFLNVEKLKLSKSIELRIKYNKSVYGSMVKGELFLNDFLSATTCASIKLSEEQKLQFINDSLDKLANRKVRALENRDLYTLTPLEDKVFLTSKQLDWFMNQMQEFTHSREDQHIERGFQAHANAIFSNKKCRKHIFEQKVKLADYMRFLEEKFETKFTNYKKLTNPGQVRSRDIAREIKKLVNNQ